MDRPDTPAELKVRALRYLVRREHSRAELARKLAPRADSQETLESVLEFLLSKKLLSNERFAEARAQSLARKYGAARIRQDLKARGVADEISEKVSSGLNDLERAKAILERKYRQPCHTREERARRARFLQSRGFSLDVIRALVLRAED
jgi:regulatory protein